MTIILNFLQISNSFLRSSLWDYDPTGRSFLLWSLKIELRPCNCWRIGDSKEVLSCKLSYYLLSLSVSCYSSIFYSSNLSFVPIWGHWWLVNFIISFVKFLFSIFICCIRPIFWRGLQSLTCGRVGSIGQAAGVW